MVLSLLVLCQNCVILLYMTTEQVNALRSVANAIIETVKLSGPLGAPGGHLYAALMASGCSLHQFEQIMAGLVSAKMLTKTGECYTVTEGGI
jgi:hypothetical protein